VNEKYAICKKPLVIQIQEPCVKNHPDGKTIFHSPGMA